MPVFRKRPVEITGDQWFSSKTMIGVIIPEVNVIQGKNGNADKIAKPYVLDNRKRKLFLSEGDYVINDPDGVHHYVMNANQIEILYEEVYNGL